MKKAILHLCVAALFLTATMPRFHSARAARQAVEDSEVDLVLFTPEQVILGNAGIVYLLDEETQAVYRYSRHQDRYLPAIALHDLPLSISYAPGSNRLYIAYDYAVRQVQLNSSIQEQPFAVLNTNFISGMTAAGDFVFVSQEYGAGATFWVYTGDGTVAHHSEPGCFGCTRSQEYVWSDINRRVYYRDGTVTGGALNSVTVGLDGALSEYMTTGWEAPDIELPLHLSTDETLIMDGSGDTFNTLTLKEGPSVWGEFIDAAWVSGERYFMVQLYDNTEVGRLGGERRDLEGTPLALLSVDGELLAVTDYQGSPRFYTLNAVLEVLSDKRGYQYAYLPLIRRPWDLYLPPATYSVNRCAEGQTFTSNGATLGVLTECVTSVEIHEEGTMQFNFTWMVDLAPGINQIVKHSDAYNHNMYVVDNLGQRYDHIAVGGAAAESLIISDRVPVTGYFMFEPAQNGAHTFAFHDDDNVLVMNGIRLGP